MPDPRLRPSPSSRIEGGAQEADPALAGVVHPDRGGAGRRLGGRDEDSKRRARRSPSYFSRPRGSKPARPRSTTTASTSAPSATIRLTEDHQRVIATAQMAPRTEDFLVEDTRVLGGAAANLGRQRDRAGHPHLRSLYRQWKSALRRSRKRDFVALETPPVITGNVPGRFFVLKTPDLGSLDTGTPMFFRRLQVGQVASYALDKDGQSFTVKVFVRAPYDQYVTPNTRFWQASGVDLSLSANGLSVQTQSLLSILIGGIAFETPPRPAGLCPRPTRTPSSRCSSNRARGLRAGGAQSADLRAHLQRIGPRAGAGRAGRVPRRSDRRGSPMFVHKST